MKEWRRTCAVFIPRSALTTPHLIQGRDVIVSISACDADCAGANPVALTILKGLLRGASDR